MNDATSDRRRSLLLERRRLMRAANQDADFRLL
jgi:hypothetical protein